MPILLNPAWVAYINPAPASPYGPPPPAGSKYQMLAGVDGPITATANAVPVTVGTEFQVTDYGMYLYGYWLWVCPGGGQSTSAQTFALWQVTGTATGTYVTGSSLTSGTLTAGEWNCAAYSTKPPLTPGVPYRAVTGFTGPYPATANQWNAGGPYAAGLTNAPLTGFSDATGSAPDAYGSPQAGLSTAGSDPTANYPGTGNSGFNAWLDIEIISGP